MAHSMPKKCFSNRGHLPSGSFSFSLAYIMERYPFLTTEAPYTYICECSCLCKPLRQLQSLDDQMYTIVNILTFSSNRMTKCSQVWQVRLYRHLAFVFLKNISQTAKLYILEFVWNECHTFNRLYIGQCNT